MSDGLFPSRQAVHLHPAQLAPRIARRAARTESVIRRRAVGPTRSSTCRHRRRRPGRRGLTDRPEHDRAGAVTEEDRRLDVAVVDVRAQDLRANDQGMTDGWVAQHAVRDRRESTDEAGAVGLEIVELAALQPETAVQPRGGGGKEVVAGERADDDHRRSGSGAMLGRVPWRRVRGVQRQVDADSSSVDHETLADAGLLDDPLRRDVGQASSRTAPRWCARASQGRARFRGSRCRSRNACSAIRDPGIGAARVFRCLISPKVPTRHGRD